MKEDERMKTRLTGDGISQGAKKVESVLKRRKVSRRRGGGRW